MTDKEKEKYSKNTGVTMAGVGASLYGAGKLAELNGKGKFLNNLASSKNLQQWAKKHPAEFKKAVRDVKLAGGVTLGIGGGLLGYSAYKHYKDKKKEKEDDNKETKD